MPSDTEIVPNSSGNPPAAWTPLLAALASRSSDRLHGVISFQEDATPICGFSQSSSPMPTARSMPRAAAFSSPSVTSRLRGLMSGMARMLRRTPTPDSSAIGPRESPHRPQTGLDGLDHRESHLGGADHHHVGQVAHELGPGGTVVEGAPDTAVAGAEVDPRRLVVVHRHRVAHHAHIERVG